MSDAPLTSLEKAYAEVAAELETAGQKHLLHHWPDLDESSRRQLIEQLQAIDWQQIARLVKTHVHRKPEFTLPENIEPAPYYPCHPTGELIHRYADARETGDQLIREGKVAAFTVAGGQGTRLGWDGPKGTFPATPVRKQSLFGVYAEYIQKTQQKYDSIVPWYIMTSQVNHEPTVAYFKERNYFGLDPANVMFFSQAMMPALDMQTGKALLESPDTLALSPNGHGGSLKALYTSGAIDDMKKRGVEHLSYIQVDNPLVRVIDPLFIGLHAADGSQMSSKMLPKAYGKEKLGNFCLIDGKLTVIEYSDLPDHLAEQRLPNGELRFSAGSIAIHCLRVDFVEWLNDRPEGFALPFHRAEKKVPHLDLETGQYVEPRENNAVKLEMFVFDALPLCDTSIILESHRLDYFAPIKNADGEGAVDCPATSRKLQIERAARWLEAVGVDVPRDDAGNVAATIELTPLAAVEPSDLREIDLPSRINEGEQIVI